MTALHCAVAFRNHEVMNELLNAKADVNAKNKSENKPLTMAERLGDEVAIVILRNHCAKI